MVGIFAGSPSLKSNEMSWPACRRSDEKCALEKSWLDAAEASALRILSLFPTSIHKIEAQLGRCATTVLKILVKLCAYM